MEIASCYHGSGESIAVGDQGCRREGLKQSDKHF